MSIAVRVSVWILGSARCNQCSCCGIGFNAKANTARTEPEFA